MDWRRIPIANRVTGCFEWIAWRTRIIPVHNAIEQHWCTNVSAKRNHQIESMSCTLCKTKPQQNETNVLNKKLKNYPAVLTMDDKIVIPCNTKPKANKNAMTVKASHTQNLCLLPLTQWNVRFLLEKSVPSPSQSNPYLCSFCWKELAPTKLQSNPERSPVKKQHRQSYQKRICESTEPPEII